MSEQIFINIGFFLLGMTAAWYLEIYSIMSRMRKRLDESTAALEKSL